MTDPTFKTREELEAWAKIKARYASVPPPTPARLKTLRTIRRVTLAHSHLLGDKP